MNKRERLAKTIAGEPTDRIPVALWRHWPGDDQRAADLARSTIEFQKLYNWDFVRVTPASNFCVTDFGLQDEWQGSVEGTRAVIKRIIQRSLDWTELRPLDPTRGTFGRQLECLRLIAEGMNGDETPIVQTIPSPLAQAEQAAGAELLIRHMRTQPERLHTGLNTLTESTMRFMEAMKKLPVAGVSYVIQHASYDVMSEDEYRIFGLPYDRKILESIPEKWWFNSIHLNSEAPMFRLCSNLPAQVIQWYDQAQEPNLALGKSLFTGAICGGLSRWQHLHSGTPNSVREQARAAMQSVNNRRFILSSDDAILVTTPLSNLRAARDIVETVGA
jgi:uroporphyrinogen decarboxylase